MDKTTQNISLFILVVATVLYYGGVIYYFGITGYKLTVMNTIQSVQTPSKVGNIYQIN